MKILVIGGGSIGGSIALRLRERSYRVSVFDTCEKVLSTLFYSGIETGPLDLLLPSNEITVIATPMNVELELLESMEFNGPVMDVASVMRPFHEVALRRKIRFINGHPMAGNERSGPAGWDRRMFEGRPFFLSPCGTARNGDISAALKIVNDLGARPEFIEPIEHDEILSRISQGLYYLSRAAMKLGKNYEKYAGPGFASTTRLGRQNIEMALDMARYNGDNIAEALGKIEEYLHKVKEAIRSKNMVELAELMDLEEI
jgi:prephenate dehydrogenase